MTNVSILPLPISGREAVELSERFDVKLSAGTLTVKVCWYKKDETTIAEVAWDPNDMPLVVYFDPRDTRPPSFTFSGVNLLPGVVPHNPQENPPGWADLLAASVVRRLRAR